MIIGIQDELLRINSLGLLDRLLEDRTTKAHILWATDAYTDLGPDYQRDKEIRAELITGEHSGVIKNRARKALEQQSARTRQHAEVFTPHWVCAKMCAYADEVWFGKQDRFFRDGEPTGRVVFPKRKSWKRYVDERRMEITCGEAPFLVSRYDVSNGESIPLARRTGLLDRKLRVVGENAETEEEWLQWAMRALQATYGYEFQGDNLLISRVNLLTSFEEYLFDRWERKPTKQEYETAANIIVWNIFQMDGLTNAIPYRKAEEAFFQFNILGEMGFPDGEEKKQPYCRVCDWRKKTSFEFQELRRGKGKMKFDFIIGNPPYQESGTTNNKAEPLYPYYYSAAEKITNRYILISPARFLFNAGLTAKTWNEKMLSDIRITIKDYFHNSADVFPNTNINGGVVIIYRDADREFSPIGMFIPDKTLRGISDKFKGNAEANLSTIVYGGRSDLKFNDVFIADFPNTAERILRQLQSKHPQITKLGPNEEYELKSSSFERTPYAFIDKEPDNPKDYYKILGVEKGKRVYKWVPRKYMSPRYPRNNNIECFKVMLSNADGAAGQIGKPIPARIIGKPIVAGPGTSSFPTFMSIGNFKTESEARCVEKYIQTKFVRVLLRSVYKELHADRETGC